jgi:23S rRNA pseudouridine2605 synthase
MAAPETHLNKIYHVQIGTVADDKLLQTLVRGVKSKDGDVLRAIESRMLRSGAKNCWLEIVLDEGKNRQIRRMLAALGVEVLRLVRVAIGPLNLGDLPKGASRPVANDEKRLLDEAVWNAPAPPKGGSRLKPQRSRTTLPRPKAEHS